VRVFDLSVPIRDGMDWYREEGTPPVRLDSIGSLDRDGWVSHTLSMQVLNGTTYLETAGHLFEDGATLDDVPPEDLVRRAFVVGLPPGERELPSPEATLGAFRSGEDALLLHCGWDSHIESDDFYHASPYFSAPLQEWILDHNPGILGADVPSFDRPDDAGMPFLHEYFRRGGMILSPLVSVGAIPAPVVTLCVAPLRLVGANAAPCRVLAWIPGSEEGAL